MTSFVCAVVKVDVTTFSVFLIFFVWRFQTRKSRKFVADVERSTTLGFITIRRKMLTVKFQNLRNLGLLVYLDQSSTEFVWRHGPYSFSNFKGLKLLGLAVIMSPSLFKLVWRQSTYATDLESLWVSRHTPSTILLMNRSSWSIRSWTQGFGYVHVLASRGQTLEHCTRICAIHVTKGDCLKIPFKCLFYSVD